MFLDEITVVLDTRNDYEYDLWSLSVLHCPDIRNFQNCHNGFATIKEEFMDKRVVVYRTGGVSLGNSQVDGPRRPQKIKGHCTVVSAEKIQRFKGSFGW